MNCKPGDLAVVVGGDCLECIGCFCRLIEQSEGFFSQSIVWTFKDATGALAKYEKKRILDKCLRPIRDDDGQDETLIWAGKPEKLTCLTR